MAADSNPSFRRGGNRPLPGGSGRDSGTVIAVRRRLAPAPPGDPRLAGLGPPVNRLERTAPTRIYPSRSDARHRVSRPSVARKILWPVTPVIPSSRQAGRTSVSAIAFRL